MLLCDYCLLWYHAKCEDVSVSMVDNIDSYKCHNCNNWLLKQERLFTPVLCQATSEQLLLPNNSGEEQDLSGLACWQNSIFPDNPAQSINLDDVLLIGTIWQQQVDSILKSESILNIDLIRQQIVYAQYIPLNLMDGVDKLNALVDKVAQHAQQEAAESGVKMELKPVVDSDLPTGNIDQEAIESNKVVKERAEAFIEEETKKHRIYSYKAIELKNNIVDVYYVVEKCLQIVTDQAKLSYQGIIDLREQLYITRKKNKGLKAKLQAKFFLARGWYRSYEDIEMNSKRIWGQLKTDVGQNAKVFAPKENVTEAKRLIEHGEDIMKFCDISEHLSLLKQWLEMSVIWDVKYKDVTSSGSSDGIALSKLLKEAQSMSVKTPTMIVALAEMKKNKIWINECKRFFTDQNREEKTMA